MEGFDPLRDTYHVAVGGSVKRTQRPGERITHRSPKPRKAGLRIGSIINAKTLSILLLIVVAMLIRLALT